MAIFTIRKVPLVAEDVAFGMGTTEQLRGTGTELNANLLPYSASETTTQAIDRKEDSISVDAKLATKAELNGSPAEEFDVAPATADTEAVPLAQLEEGLALKADQDYTDAQLALKAQLHGSIDEIFQSAQGTGNFDVVTIAKLTADLLLKADLTYVNQQLDLKSSEDNTLLKDGSSPTFTPVSENQPSTKKYVDDRIIDAGAGDMLKAVYDTDNSGAVDTAEAIGREGTFLGKTPMNEVMRLSQSNVVDCNILDDFGIFVGNDVANAPTNGPIGLEQLAISTGKAQRCFSFTTNLWYDRVFTGSIWSGWSAWAKLDSVVRLDGASTMTGNLDFVNGQAIRMQADGGVDLRNAITRVANGNFQFGSDNVNIVGLGTWTYNENLSCNVAPTAAQHLTRKDYVDTMLPLAGGTMTGPLKISADAAQPLVINRDVVSGDVSVRFQLNDANKANVAYSGAALQLYHFDEENAGVNAGVKFSVYANSCVAHVPIEGVAPTQVSHLTRKDYVDGQNATQDAEIATKIRTDGAVASLINAGGVGTNRMSTMVSCTQAQYDASPKYAACLYVIVG